MQKSAAYWEDMIHRLDVPTATTWETAKVCGVKQPWGYPVWWESYGPSGTRVANETWIGFRFKAKIEYRRHPSEIYDCKCCVFRQYLKTTVTVAGHTSTEDWHRDKESSGAEYGGGRADDSGPDDANVEKMELGKESAGGCVLECEDSPHQKGQSIRPDEFEITYDFVGVVFDRCHKFAFVDAERMLLYRKGHCDVLRVFDKLGDLEEELDVLMEDDASATTQVPPTAKAADDWTHESGTEMPGIPALHRSKWEE